MNEKFSAELNRLMRQHEPSLSIRELADELGLTYEFARKLVRGYNLPTRGSMIIMASLFGVQVTRLEEFAQEDRMTAEFGPEITSIIINPETRTLVSGLAELNEAERQEVLSLLQKLLKNARVATT